MSVTKVNLVADESLSAAEREEKVLTDAGVQVDDTSVTKVDLTKPQQDAVQEQSTDEGVLGSQEPEVGLQEVGEGDKEPEVATE